MVTEEMVLNRTGLIEADNRQCGDGFCRTCKTIKANSAAMAIPLKLPDKVYWQLAPAIYDYLGEPISILKEAEYTSAVKVLKDSFAAASKLTGIEFTESDPVEGETFYPIRFQEIDGKDKTLAENAYPYIAENGEIATWMRIDPAEYWSETKLFLVALHEIFHGLGIKHIMIDVIALMRPFYDPTLTGATDYDIQALRDYGYPDPAEKEEPEPAFNFFAWLWRALGFTR